MKRKSLSAKKTIHKNFLKQLKNTKNNKIYLSFEKSLNKYANESKFAVAVSGGKDSLALSFLAKCYSIQNKKKILLLSC